MNFKPKATTQAIAILIEGLGPRATFRHILDLLYLADRESVIACGSQITDSGVKMATKRPILYGGVRVLESEMSIQVTFTRKRGFWFVAKDPGTSELSESDIEALHRVLKEHGASEDLGPYLLSLPEVKGYDPSGWYWDVALAAAGLTPPDRTEMLRKREYFAAVDNYFRNKGGNS